MRLGRGIKIALGTVLVLAVLGTGQRGRAPLRAIGAPSGNLSEAREALELGIDRQGAGDLDGAEAAYRRAVALAPELAEAHSNLCKVRFDRRRIDEAIESCRKALAIAPGLEPARYNLAQAFLAKGNFSEAAVAFRELSRTRPRDARVFLGLGGACFGLRAYVDAADAFSRAASLNPVLREARCNLAATYEKLGRRREAIGEYRQCRTLLSPGGDRDRVDMAIRRLEADSP